MADNYDPYAAGGDLEAPPGRAAQYEVRADDGGSRPNAQKGVGAGPSIGQAYPGDGGGDQEVHEF